MFTFRLTATLLLALATLSFAGPLDQKQIGPVRIDKAAILAQSSAYTPVAPPTGGTDRERPTLDDELIWSESFENTVTGFLPSGWLMVDGDGGFCNQWNRQSTFIVFDYGQQNSHTGVRCALVHYNDAAAANNDWLISPVITAGAPLTLHYWAAAQDPSYPESWEVRVSTTGRNPGDFTNIVETVTDAPALWIRHSLDLTPFAGQSIYIAWHYNSTDRYLLKLDDIDIEAGGHGPAGDINGIVRYDRTPNPARGLEDATVTIVETGATTMTRADGTYSLRYVAPGTYSLSVMHPEYTTLIVPNVVVSNGQVVDSANALVFDAERSFVRVRYLGAPAADISDFDTAVVNFAVTTSLNVFDIDLFVNLTHTWVGDLDIWLRSPGGETVQLFRSNVNLSGDDFEWLGFDDEATVLLTEGQPPFTGSFRPYQALANFDGDAGQGTWSLLVYDGIAEDFGLMGNCSLIVAFNSGGPLATDDPIALPQQFEFVGNYPNPFNPSTTFEFTLGQSSTVTLAIYNLLGEQVATVVDNHLTTGTHRIEFDGRNLSSGVFFAKLSIPQQSATRKIVLLK